MGIFAALGTLGSVLSGAGAAAAGTGMTTATALGTLASAGLGIGGTLMQASAIKQQAETQASLYEANAQFQRNQADLATEAGKQEELKFSKEQRQTLGTQSALYGAAGVSMSGSPLDVMADTAAKYESDINMMGYNTEIKRNAYNYQAQLYDWQAGRMKDAGDTASTMTLLTGFGKSLLGVDGVSMRDAGVDGVSMRDAGDTASTMTPLTGFGKSLLRRYF